MPLSFLRIRAQDNFKSEESSIIHQKWRFAQISSHNLEGQIVSISHTSPRSVAHSRCVFSVKES